jgi:hypothetical protein
LRKVTAVTMKRDSVFGIPGDPALPEGGWKLKRGSRR